MVCKYLSKEWKGYVVCCSAIIDFSEYGISYTCLDEVCPKYRLKYQISQKCWQIKSQSSSAEHSEKQPPHNVGEQHTGSNSAGCALHDKLKLSTHDTLQSLSNERQPAKTLFDAITGKAETTAKRITHDTTQSPDPAGAFSQNREITPIPQKSPSPADDTHKEAK